MSNVEQLIQNWKDERKQAIDYANAANARASQLQTIIGNLEDAIARDSKAVPMAPHDF